MRIGFGLALSGILLAGCVSEGAPAGPAEADGGGPVWNGAVWKSDYFRPDDLFAWSHVEAVYRVARLVAGPGEDGYATFRAAGREGEVLKSRRYFRTRPARPSDLFRTQEVFVPASVRQSPGHAVGMDGPGGFAERARRETWVAYEVLNTAELPEGRVYVRRGDRRYTVPTWCLRVRAD